MALQCMCFTRVSASVKTIFAFSLVWGHNACVSHACLHLLRRLLRFSSYRVTMHVFHMRVCICKDDFFVFLGMALQCSHACLHMAFALYGAEVHVFHTCLCIYKTAFAFSLSWVTMQFHTLVCIY